MLEELKKEAWERLALKVKFTNRKGKEYITLIASDKAPIMALWMQHRGFLIREFYPKAYCTSGSFSDSTYRIN